MEEPCRELRLIYYGESSKDYVEAGPYKLLTDEGGKAVTFYDRPTYLYDLDYKDCVWLFLYTGRRWSDTEWCDEQEDPRMVFAKKNNTRGLHAYWDDMLQGDNTFSFSEPSTSVSGTNLAMFQFSSSGSKRRHAPLAEHTPIKASFECVDVGCQKDEAVCGDYGVCTPSPDNTTYTCLCNDYFGGQLCQIDPHETYAYNQFSSWCTDSRFENEYTDLFWKHQNVTESCL